MPTPQQQINYGNTANDGQGDPLRTAFIKTDYNFDAIWAAGPVGSNITVLNNTLQVQNTNGNITLSPNGIGIVQANASILPNTSNIRDLGSATQIWRRAYIGRLNSTELSISGDTVIAGNLTVEGDTIQIGNIISNLYADGEVEILGNVNIENSLTVDGLLVDTVAGITANAGNIDINQITGLGGYLNATGAVFSGNITGNTAGFAIGYRDIPQVSFTANTTIAAADAGKHFYSTQSTNYVLTIANNSAVSWPAGTAVTVVNRGTGNMTIAQGTGVSLYLAGNSSAGNRTVTTYGMATLLNVAANVWMINGTGVS
jgi:hypothetical protein